MNVIVRNAKIIDAESTFHNQIIDLILQNGSITNIGINLENHDHLEEVILDNLHLSRGWFDSSVSLGEPGFEERETIANGLDVAAKSGFTAIAVQPNSFPVIDNQSHINFLISKSQGFATNLIPIGALTKNSEGKDLAELFDMQKSGAVAFGDYNRNLENPNLLKIALQYVQDFDGLIIAFSEDEKIKANGVVNEGRSAINLGLKGIPHLAEEIVVARNLFLLEYTGGKLHIPTISTEKSVSLIRDAKEKGLNVTCSVAVHQLLFTDEKLDGFDTRFKVCPPLRTENDRKALITGVTDGTIDLITSDHNPIDIEHKKMEFDKAKNGTIGLETAFAALMILFPLEVVISKLTSGRKLFSISEIPAIAENSIANLTFFCPSTQWKFTKENILSKSKNSAFLHENLIGKVYGVFNNNKLVLSHKNE